MVVTCPQCKVRLKVDDAKIPPQGARFKCPKCSSAIFIKPPTHPVVPEREGSGISPEKTTPYAETPKEKAHVLAGKAEASIRKDILDKTKVLIAHGDKELLEEMEKLVREAGYTPIVSQDGIDAIVKASKELPFMAVLDVALPKEYGFELCKKMREIEYTKDIKVILIASVYDKTRYKRPPASTYGADEIIEDHEVKELLIPKIEALKLGGESAKPGVPFTPPVSRKEREGASIGSVAQSTVEEPVKKTVERPIPKGLDSFIPPSRETAPSKIQVKVPESEGASISQELPVTEKIEIPSQKIPRSVGKAMAGDEMEEKARRLARTIISDIYLYNPKKFEEAIKKGTFYETFQEELKEGAKLYESRIPPEIRKRADFFKEEMEFFIENKKKEMNF